jgi:uncharacterized protein (DUF362 family)
MEIVMKTFKNNPSNLSRRDFIKKTSVSALGISMLGSISSIFTNDLFGKSVDPKSRIVLVRNSNVIDENGMINLPLLKEMLEKGILSFSGEKSNKDFWQKKFSKSETIGLKVNTLGLNSITGTNLTDHFSALTNAIIESFTASGFDDNNFIIWDRSEEELKSAGYVIHKEKDKTRIVGSVETRRGEGGIGFTEQEFPVGEKKTKLAKILTELCSSLINIPQLKDHGTAGFTGALKNHYGTISNAREFHSNNCTNPGIPEINLIPEIRDKQKLIITDALMGVFNGGPRWERNFMWPFGGILIGTDPVAMDTVMLNIINEKRKLEGMSPISENVTKHIKLSAELGIGKNNLSQIELIEINLSK